ncbi:ribosomal protein L13 [Acidimicrobium ferrooxidans DSM 10331]|uniref:Large ribosomal subunit protein uL13 n=1 Tax=Acidimicrobium ferrooxidans (strain DSM 10331 / JCM 15462 / NBRC 103882 / ICP) TaxID=525909 RepID=C7M303_ACIFD|nr:50S ribosomal protein L13 [Acidimicrobium ferrooxidans]ACU53397.1 ribosomal protein L13 [Acidimicrobium ferrooxidans DSM 10331]
MRTYSPKAAEISRTWWVVDAEDVVLGRLATEVARVLRGKHKPTFTPHLDMGDHVIVVNADKIRVTSDKGATKRYWRHSGYPGGIRSETLAERLARHPERVVEAAVRGMLPKNRLGRAMYRKLKVYAGPEHPHQAQQPRVLSLGQPSLVTQGEHA